MILGRIIFHVWILSTHIYIYIRLKWLITYLHNVLEELIFYVGYLIKIVKVRCFLINLFTSEKFVDYKGLFELRKEERGVKENRIKMTENRLILDNFTLLYFLKSEQTISLAPKVEKFCHQTIAQDNIISSRRYILGFISNFFFFKYDWHK